MKALERRLDRLEGGKRQSPPLIMAVATAPLPSEPFRVEGSEGLGAWAVYLASSLGFAEGGFWMWVTDGEPALLIEPTPARDIPFGSEDERVLLEAWETFPHVLAAVGSDKGYGWICQSEEQKREIYQLARSSEGA